MSNACRLRDSSETIVSLRGSIAIRSSIFVARSVGVSVPGLPGELPQDEVGGLAEADDDAAVGQVSEGGGRRPLSSLSNRGNVDHRA
jgi:hypothetical protein